MWHGIQLESHFGGMNQIRNRSCTPAIQLPDGPTGPNGVGQPTGLCPTGPGSAMSAPPLADHAVVAGLVAVVGAQAIGRARGSRTTQIRPVAVNERMMATGALLPSPACALRVSTDFQPTHLPAPDWPHPHRRCTRSTRACGQRNRLPGCFQGHYASDYAGYVGLEFRPSLAQAVWIAEQGT